MSVLVLSAADVARLVPMADCIALMRDTMQAVSHGDAALPLRIGAGAPEGTFAVAAMPGWLGRRGSAGVSPLANRPSHASGSLGGKLISVAVRRGDAPIRSHQGVVVLFDAASGAPTAIVEAAAVTALRTAAATAVATDVLARADAVRLAMIGTGEQARAHVDALANVRALREIRVWGRDAGRTRDFAAELSARHGVAVSIAPTVRDAVIDADVVVTATAAREPILRGEWLQPGSHVNLVGASSRAAREADEAVVTRSRFFVDHRASAFAQAGELLHAAESEARPDDVAAFVAGEIGEVLAGGVTGRRSATEVTVYKSLGIAAQDLALASEIVARARESGAGTHVEL